jgi:hypothetical protein
MAADAEPITRTGMKTAVALVARLALAPDVPRDAVLGDAEPGDVLAAMEAITAGLLHGIWPQDKGAQVLTRIGLAVADLEGGKSQ